MNTSTISTVANNYVVHKIIKSNHNFEGTRQHFQRSVFHAKCPMSKHIHSTVLKDRKAFGEARI